MKDKDEKKTLLLYMKDGTLKKITIPSEWKVTFGNLFPGGKGQAPSGGPALRLYSTKGVQHAVFTDVESFRDMAIGIEERITEKKQETYFKKDGDGEGEAIVAEVQVHRWQNPDNPSKKKDPQKHLKVVRE